MQVFTPYPEKYHPVWSQVAVYQDYENRIANSHKRRRENSTAVESFEFENDYFNWEKKRKRGEYIESDFKPPDDRAERISRQAAQDWKLGVGGIFDIIDGVKMDDTMGTHHGHVAIPMHMGKKGRRHKIKHKSKFARKVARICDSILQKNFPLEICARGPTSAHSTNETGLGGMDIRFSTVDLANGLQSGSLPLNIDFFYDSTCFGVTPYSGTFPSIIGTSQGLVMGPTTGNLNDPLVNTNSFGTRLFYNSLGWYQFLGQNGLAVSDDEWVELRYEKLCLDVTISDMLSDVSFTVYYLLIPYLNILSSGDFLPRPAGSTQSQAQVNQATAVSYLQLCMGRGDFIDDMPKRYNPEKRELMVMWSKKFRFPPGRSSMTMLRPQNATGGAPINAGSPLPVNSQYLCTDTQRRYKRCFTFKYGKGGLRLFCTSQAGSYLPAVPTDTFVYFFWVMIVLRHGFLCVSLSTIIFLLLLLARPL